MSCIHTFHNHHFHPQKIAIPDSTHGWENLTYEVIHSWSEFNNNIGYWIAEFKQYSHPKFQELINLIVKTDEKIKLINEKFFIWQYKNLNMPAIHDYKNSNFETLKSEIKVDTIGILSNLIDINCLLIFVNMFI